MLKHDVVITIALLCSCGDDSGGAGTLRSNVSEVYRGAESAGCQDEFVDLCPTYERVVVSDADAEGDRIAVVRLHQLQFVSMDVSENRGATWSHYTLDQALATDIPWDGFDIGVHLQGGRTFLLLSRPFSPRTTEWGLYEVSFQAPRMLLTEITPSSILHPFSFAAKHPDGHLRGVVTLGADVPVAYDLDATTGEISYEEPMCTGQACTPASWFSADGGTSFHGYSQPGAGLDVCHMRWHESEPPSQQCVRAPLWFQPAYSHRMHVMIHGEATYTAWSQDGEAYALGISPAGGLTPVLPLGPGVVENFPLGRLRLRFPGFEYLQPVPPITHGRLVQVGDSGPEEVHFRETPCDSDPCFYGGYPDYGLTNMQFVIPTGRGDYYVFYVAQVAEASDRNQQVLYLARSETPTFTPITASGPLPGPAVVPPPADASPMTALQNACAQAASCSGFQPGPSYFACIRRFTTSDTAAPYHAAARTHFVAAAGQGCAALNAAWYMPTAGCTPQCFDTGGTCMAGGTCSNALAISHAACGTCADASTYLACDTQTVFATTCPGGTTCATGVGCVPTPACAGGSSCSGTDLVTCDAQTSATMTTECAPNGATCNASSPACEATPLGASCNPQTYSTVCDGPYLKACGPSGVVYTDCRSIGFLSCEVVIGGGRCL